MIHVVKSARSPSASACPGQQIDERVQIRHRKCAQELDTAGHRPEAGQGFEGTEGDDQLRFVAAVAVVAGRGGNGDVQAVLARESLDCLRGTRMCLQREGLLGGENLGQERKRIAETGAGGRPQLTLRVCGDGVEQGPLPAVACQPGGVTRIGAEPEFSLGMRCGTGPSSELRNGGV